MGERHRALPAYVWVKSSKFGRLQPAFTLADVWAGGNGLRYEAAAAEDDDDGGGGERRRSMARMPSSMVLPEQVPPDEYKARRCSPHSFKPLPNPT